MTRKEQFEIAETIYLQCIDIEDSDVKDANKAWQILSLRKLTNRLCRQFLDADERFDPVAFMEACGF